VADRSCYDLTQHAAATGTKLVAEKRLAQPKTVDLLVVIANKQTLGQKYKANSKAIITYLNELNEAASQTMSDKLAKDGTCSVTLEGDAGTFALTPADVTIKREQRQVNVEEVVPSVIEPSFGIGRIMFAVFEHNFRARDGADELRQFIALPPLIAPIKCSVLPLSNKPELRAFVDTVCANLIAADMAYRTEDSSTSVGKRYSRTDEIGIPYGCTIDFDTIHTGTVTLRERDSMTQVRCKIDEIGALVSALCTGRTSWAQVQTTYPKFEQQEVTK